MRHLLLFTTLFTNYLISVPEDIAIGNKNINREQRQMSYICMCTGLFRMLVKVQFKMN